MRDYVKSMKHYWDEAAFVADVGDGEAAWKVASRLRQLREDDFVGGFVLREFEPFTSAEVRTWWVDGRCVLIGPHPDTRSDPGRGVYGPRRPGARLNGSTPTRRSP
ncbi:ATP-grasp domain-containing protein [Micromonospora sp. NBC_00389]|uniref:ATP-grasp domain-containing protein n=1 Tax=Micromonospora sp. NBC_00389 TaxID=2903586 RepID=UPI002E1A0ECA